MQRLDDPTTYNLFGWRLAELESGICNGERRRRLLDELAVWEALEVAHGFRHVTVVHGDPTTLAESRRLSAFYEQLAVIIVGSSVRRVRGTERFVTVTTAGSGKDSTIAVIGDAAARGGWTARATIVPPDLAISNDA